MMLAELTTTLSQLPAEARRGDYSTAIMESNCLSKPTASTRRLTNQRLSELYGLDPSLAVFRILRRLWGIDVSSRPLLALLCVLARDPMLASTAPSVVPLPPGSEFQRGQMRDLLRAFVGERLSDSTLDKVVRNAASTWAQSGHLNQDFRFGPGTAIVYIRAAPNTTSFRAEPCTSPPPVGARARPSVHRR